jgi:RHS repeat-associated protein
VVGGCLLVDVEVAMSRMPHRTRVRTWRACTVVVTTLALVASGLSWPGTAVAAPPAKGPGKVQPRGDDWTSAKTPKSTTVAYKQQPGRSPLRVVKPDPHAKRVKELTNKRTANGSYFQMSDGSVQQEVSALPVHYRDAKGAWQNIDSSVKKVSHGGFSVGAQGNAFQTYFSPNASSLVRIEQGATSVQMGADEANTAAPKVTGSSVSYAGAYPGADLTYQVGPQAVTEDIVLSKAPATGQSYSFTVNVGSGLMARQLADGAIEFDASESGAAVFTIPAPYMSDAKDDVNSPYGKVYSTKVSQTLSLDATTSGVVHVTVTPDAKWLSDAKRVYPVRIDPTILVAPTPSTAANTMILADGATTNYNSSWRLSVGTTTTGAARTLIKFPLPAIPSGTTITSADLGLYYDQTFTTDANNVPMQALQANAAWTPTTATWSNASSIGGPVAGTGTMTARAAGVWVHFPVASAVQNWVNGTANNGFVLKATNEATLGQGGPRFEGSLYSYGGEVVNYPKLTITYGAPGVAVNPPSVIHATGAELSWPAYTNTTGDSNNDLAEYQVHRSVFQAFTPGQATLVSPVASTVAKSFVDSTAIPTAADSADPYGNAYYYMVAVKTKGGALIPGPTQLVRLPKAGRTTLLIPVSAATTLGSGQPTSVLNTLSNSGTAEPWLEVGDNSSTYGVARSVFDFGALSQVPSGSKVLDAHLKVWQESTTTNSTGAVYELHGLTRSFTGTQATWNGAATGTAWTTAGGDFSATVGGTVSGLTNDPNRQNFDATSIVQGWVNTPTSNHGLLVKLKAEASTSPQERTIFAGPKTAESRLAPQLVVTYLDSSTGATYYAPSTPTDMVVGQTYNTPVTINNTTSATWAAANEVLTYHWNLPDGSDVTAPANQLQTKLPSDLAPGATVTLNAQVTPPVPTDGNQAEGYSIAWDMYNTSTGMYLSGGAPASTSRAAGATPAAGTSGTGSLKEQVSVDPIGNNQLGLENFYQYTTTPTGSGTALYTNLSSGNTVWNDDLFSNPSRGFSTFLRLTYNSLSTFDTSAGFGWTLEASAPMRVGQGLQFNPTWSSPTEVVLVDGTGNAHRWTWNATANDWSSPPGVHLHLKRLVACTPQTLETTRAWSMTRPDRTVYYFDCNGYPRATVDKNGNEADFSYSQRQSQNKPREFLTYITDPLSRQTLTVTYYNKGDSFSYIDSSTWNMVDATNLTDPAIIDHIKSITDVGGRTVNFYYTSEGLLGRLVDGFGTNEAKTFNFTYDMTQGMKNVKLITVQDPRNNTTNLTYYPPSSPWKWMTWTVSDRLGQTTSFSYQEPGAIQNAVQQTTVVDANNGSWVYQIDSSGRMIQAVNPIPETTSLAWDDDNNVKSLTENNGATTFWTYDQKTGYPLTFTDAQNKATAAYFYYYDPTGYTADLKDSVSAAEPHRDWHYEYDDNGNLHKAQAPNGVAAGSGFTTVYDYDGFGDLTLVTDPNGHASGYGYYQHIPGPELQYDPTGLPTTFVDPMINVTDMSYGPRGELKSITDPLQHTSTTNYDVFLRRLDSKVPKDQASGSYIITPAPIYDGNDNVTQSTAPNGAVTTNHFDEDDQLKSTTLPPNTPIAGPDRVVSYTYDKVGNRQTTTEPNGNLSGAAAGTYTTTVTYNGANRPATVKDANGFTTIIGYDKVGNKNKLTDPLNHVTQTSYDLDHRPIGTTDAKGYTTSTAYDADGLVLSTTDQNGSTTYYSLDANGQVTQVQVPHSGVAPNINYDTTQYRYDQAGNNTSVTSPRGVATDTIDNDFTTFTVYDNDNRKSQVLGAYDPTADPKSTYGKSNQPETDYTYDAAGRVTQVSQITSRDPDFPLPPVTSTYGYFDTGWMKHSADPFNITTDYDYNELGQQTYRALTSSDATAARYMNWGYYSDGSLASFSDTGVPVGWQSQVVTASSFSTEIGKDWTPGPSGKGFDGSTYYTLPQNGIGNFTWHLTPPQTGDYTIYVWYPAQDSPNPRAGYSVDGGDPVYIDQGQNAGTWVKLPNPANDNGEWKLTEGKGSTVVLKANGAPMAADAVRIVRDNSTDQQQAPTDASYSYNPNGNRTDIKDASPNAQFDDYPAKYDQLDRPEWLKEYKGGTLMHTLSYDEYDAVGNLKIQKNDDAVNTYDYDERNLLKQVVNQQNSFDTGITTAYTYTPTGQREKQTKGNGNTVTNIYNLDGTLSTMDESTKDGKTVDSHLLDYDENNNIKVDDSSLQSADDGSILSRIVTREYSPNNQVTSVKYDGNDDQAYTYNMAGNITEQTMHAMVDGKSTPVTVDYSYDRGRMANSFPAGSPVIGTYQYDAMGRLHAVANGTFWGVSTGIAQQYDYDGYDNIISQSATGADGKQQTTQYTYDSLNRPVTSTINPGDVAQQKKTFDYLGKSRVVADENLTTAGGTGTKTYDYAPTGERLALIDTFTASPPPTTETSYYTYNPHQDVEALTDPTGVAMETYGYTAYGADDPTRDTGTDKNNTNPVLFPYNSYRFNSGSVDASTGNLDMGFRTYNPNINQFLSRDMYNGSGADAGLGSRYGFAGGNPVSNVELNGHNWQTILGVGILVAAVVGAIVCVALTSGVCLGAIATAAAEGAAFGVEGSIGAAAITAIVEGGSALAAGVGGAAAAGAAAGGITAGALALEEAAGADLGADVGGADAAAADAAAADTAGADAAGADAGASEASGSRPNITCGGESFSPDTPVQLADGKSKPISKLRSGDTVKSTDTASGKTKNSKVSEVQVKHDDDLYDLTVHTAAGDQTIHTTAHHLFYDRTTRSWVQAAKLHHGDQLTTNDGTVVTVESGATPAVSSGDMWDLTIPGDHDFYILAGTTPVLVHNVNGPCPRLDDPANLMSQIAQKARMENGVEAEQNVAVYRLGEGENVRYIAAANIGKDHSETVLNKWLDLHGISPEEVTAIFSERQPCSSIPNLCAVKLMRYTNAQNDISWVLNPDGPGWTGFNAARVRDAIGDYSPNPMVPSAQWVP